MSESDKFKVKATLYQTLKGRKGRDESCRFVQSKPLGHPWKSIQWGLPHYLTTVVQDHLRWFLKWDTVTLKLTWLEVKALLDMTVHIKIAGVYKCWFSQDMVKLKCPLACCQVYLPQKIISLNISNNWNIPILYPQQTAISHFQGFPWAPSGASKGLLLP